jgi:hypothetical protein
MLQKFTETPKEGPPKMTQEDVAKGSHVTLSGTIKCDGCTEPLVVRVLPHFAPENSPASTEPPGPITTLDLAAAGAYSIKVPKGSDPVVLEVTVDANKDGKPTKGERFAVLDKAGKLVPNADSSGLDLDATDGPIQEAPAMPQGAPAGQAMTVGSGQGPGPGGAQGGPSGAQGGPSGQGGAGGPGGPGGPEGGQGGAGGTGGTGGAGAGPGGSPSGAPTIPSAPEGGAPTIPSKGQGKSSKSGG